MKRTYIIVAVIGVGLLLLAVIGNQFDKDTVTTDENGPVNIVQACYSVILQTVITVPVSYMFSHRFPLQEIPNII